jgi:hypothetical protein
MALGRELPILGYYDKQRFLQVNPEDCANWYLVPNRSAKKKFAMYPTMGRRHINYAGQNQLIFNTEPRAIFKSRNYAYFVVGNKIIRVDSNFNQIVISNTDFNTFVGDIWFDVLYTPTLTYAAFTDGIHMYVYAEETGIFTTITDTNLYLNAPNPTYIAAFGNRFVVSSSNSTQFVLSAINLGAVPLVASTCFTVSSAAIFAQEVGFIRQMAVNKNILYIFTDYTTGIWANITSTITAPDGSTSSFPFKKNTSDQFQYGMGDPLSLSVDFGFMVWLGQNQSGLIQVVLSNGQSPIPISDKAIDVLFQQSSEFSDSGISPFVEFDADGFLYQYENTIFYRLSAGNYQGFKTLDNLQQANCIEYNFDTKTWHRGIELNGERNRIQKHIYFNNRHIVSVQGDNTAYEMAGNFYTNEIRNPSQSDPQALDAYIANPFRYERITPIISEEDYGEFDTMWVQIDFVWGDQTFIYSNIGFANAVYITAEDGVTYIQDEDGSYLIAETSSTPPYVSNTPVFDSPNYFSYFKPSIELYFSDDGGVTYKPADVAHFSDIGVYNWRMRWYQLGASRNRVYKLICVSPAPIVILGGWQLTRRISGGAA